MMRARSQSGFAYIAAVVFLVVIAGIAVSLLRLTDTQQTTVNQALLGTRASLAARAGIEWVYQDLANRCNGATNIGSAGAAPSVTTTLGDFVADSGFLVTVNCAFRSYREGETDDGGAPAPIVKRIYSIKAVACNGSGACPDATSVPRPDYVERARLATVCRTANGKDCYQELFTKSE